MTQTGVGIMQSVRSGMVLAGDLANEIEALWGSNARRADMLPPF